MIRALINIYIIILIADVILSYLPNFRHQPWARTIKKLADYTCAPIRKIMPPELPFDFSPMIVIFLLKLIEAIW